VTPLRIVVADDQASVRDGLVLLLGGLPDIEVVGAAADGQQALEQVAAHQPDAILLDLRMPVLDGIGATRRLTAEHPGVAVVVLTTYVDETLVLDALRAGARSYITKDADRTDIARALHAAAGGLVVFDPRVNDTLLAAAAPAGTEPPPAVPGGLTQREAEILRLIARGLTNPEIARQLFLSSHTVKTHVNRIFAKTGSRDRAAAICYAHDHGIGLQVYPQSVDKPDAGGSPGADCRSARWSSQSCSSISQPVGTTMARTKKATTTGMAKGDPAGVSIRTGQIPIKAPVVQAMATMAAPLATPGVDSGRQAAAGPGGISAVKTASSA
jgi:DNA-binding NarL/FixJ family response regulator